MYLEIICNNTSIEIEAVTVMTCVLLILVVHVRKYERFFVRPNIFRFVYWRQTSI